MRGVVGLGSFEQPLSENRLRAICEEGLSSLALDGKKVLVLIPDHTRHSRIDLFFHILHDLLGARVSALDYLIATGTHAAMEADRLYTHVGITVQERRTVYRNVRFFNHEHENPRGLAAIGSIPANEISQLTNGAFSEPLDVTINRKVLEYDHVLLVTPVVTHEAMGFAGGNKYFFPGIAGLKVIEAFHWLAAIITNPVVNGVKDTPTRRLIDRAAEFITTPRTCLAYVVNGQEEAMCLFVGDPVEAWSRAADYSARLHITYVERPYQQVLAITPGIYEEIWVGGKAMYKLEPIIAEGGEVIVYGPQIKTISFMHDAAIRRIGYHVIEYFTKQWNRFSAEPKLIMAHSTNVRGVGKFENGVEHPRVQVTLATSLSEDVCRSVNLGYRDFRSINVNEWRSRQQDDLLVVENAGQNLYRLKNGITNRHSDH